MNNDSMTIALLLKHFGVNEVVIEHHELQAITDMEYVVVWSDESTNTLHIRLVDPLAPVEETIRVVENQPPELPPAAPFLIGYSK